MALTFERWEEILDIVNPNKGDILEQIKEELKKKYLHIYEEWKEKDFDVDALGFDILFTIGEDELYSTRHTLLHIAAFTGKLEVVKALLIEEYANVGIRTKYLETPLHYAAQNGHKDVVKVLLENGANVNAIAEHYGTPLHYAVLNGHEDVVTVLLEYEADVHERNDYDQTPLDHINIDTQLEIAIALLKEVTDFDVLNMS